MSTDLVTYDLADIPALCDRITADIAQARDIATVVEIMDRAEALRVYVRKKDAAIEAQNACAHVVLLCEHRLGEELIAAQKSGDLATGSGEINPRTRSRGLSGEKTLPATAAEVGVTHLQAFEYRSIASIRKEEIAAVVKKATSEKRAVTKREVLRRRTRKPEKKRSPIRQTIIETPAHVAQFFSWHRSGAGLVDEFTSAEELAELAAQYGDVPLDPAKLTKIIEFLTALVAVLDPARAGEINGRHPQEHRPSTNAGAF